MSRSEIVDRHLPLKPVVFHILLALADQDLHGYGIMQDVRDRSGGHIRMETGPMYRHLRRLLDDGLIAEASERPEGCGPEAGRLLRALSARAPGGDGGSGPAEGLACWERRAGPGYDRRRIMTPPERPTPLLYEWLLRVYPETFRARFGEGMRHAFAQELSAARARGHLGLAWFWVRSAVQTVAYGLLERLPVGPLFREWNGAALRDLIHGARRLRRSPGFTAAAVLTLSLGVGGDRGHVRPRGRSHPESAPVP